MIKLSNKFSKLLVLIGFVFSVNAQAQSIYPGTPPIKAPTAPASPGMGGSIPGGNYYCGVDAQGKPVLYVYQCNPINPNQCGWVIVQNGAVACGGQTQVPISPGLPPININGGASCSPQEVSLTIDAGFAHSCALSGGCVVGNGIKVQCSGNIYSGYTCTFTAVGNGQQLGQVQVSADPAGAAQKIVIKCGEIIEDVSQTIGTCIKSSEITCIESIDLGIPGSDPGVGIGVSIPFPWRKR